MKNARLPSRAAPATRFRARLLAAVMLVISAITGAVLLFADRHAESEVQQRDQQQFQSRVDFLVASQQARQDAASQRCRALAASVRIRAALEESDVEDLYRNAEVELRDSLGAAELSGKAADQEAGNPLRAEFFRFLDTRGEVLPQPAKDGAPKRHPWEKQLALSPAELRAQSIGYLAMESGAMCEVIATPIITTDTGEVIGSIILGFQPLESERQSGEAGIRNGLFVNGRLQMPGLSAAETTALAEQAAQTVTARGQSSTSTDVQLGGAPYLLFHRLLNPGSPFPPAYGICLYPLTEALDRERGLHWKILGAGLLALLVGLVASHAVARQLSAPVERLAEDSAAHQVQRARAEAALELTEQKYQSIFENAVEGIFLLAADGRLLSANPALARIFGFDSPAELCAAFRETPEPLHGDAGGLREFLQRAEQGAVASLEAEVTRRDGRKIWVSRNAHAVRDAAGTLLYFEGTLEEITERKRAADELLALNAELEAALANLKATQQQVIDQERLRALGQMASGIAHDFNNTLVPILGFCELLLLSPRIWEDREKATSYLETIQTAARDASSVVGRLREFYRPGKGKKNFEPVDLKRLVEQTITLTKPRWKGQAQANGATVQMALELEPVPAMSGDESALREALTNLIFNAVDAMPAGGTLTLRTQRRGDTAVVEVSDSGAGMTEEVRHKCLEPFFSTKGERGTGLGLSMVFGIVQRHSGTLQLETELGRGTTFRLAFPLRDAKALSLAEAPHRPKQSALRVLLVDDEAIVRDTLSAVLSADGHEVNMANDGAEGLQRFRAGAFDLVISDKAMPNLSGDQMATAIKQLSPKMPIILLTGFGLFHDKRDFPSVDVLASKPIRIPALRDAIAAAMETSIA